MGKFLYGAAVQGIQGFIFQTNKLKEIAGASELVEQICTDKFFACVGREQYNETSALVLAAGNIKYLFDSKEACQAVVRQFPKIVMEFAPGITLSQAVVALEGGEVTKSHIDILEERLGAQRNRPFRPCDVGLMAIRRARNTGYPAIESERDDNGELRYLDSATSAKLTCPKSATSAKLTCQKSAAKRVITAFFGDDIDANRVPKDTTEITATGKGDTSWLAVIHADGNNLGATMQKMAGELSRQSSGSYGETFQQFSRLLDEATKSAAQKAYGETALKYLDPIQGGNRVKEPCRPILMGGDDLTLLIRADLALPFTKLFLKNFEEETKTRFGKLKLHTLRNGLTACAGIAFIKESYPFHYGYKLAEALCTEAKKRAKARVEKAEITPSCLLFHKVQGSFVDDYETITERELRAGKIGFDVGPYYVNEQNGRSIYHLEECAEALASNEGNRVKSHLREWLSALHSSEAFAQQKMDRLLSQGGPIVKILQLQECALKEGFSPVFDWLTINSLKSER